MSGQLFPPVFRQKLHWKPVYNKQVTNNIFYTNNINKYARYLKKLKKEPEILHETSKNSILSCYR